MATLEEAPREHPESGFDERFVEADGFTIRYLIAGSGEPVGAICTAAAASASRPSTACLAERFQVRRFEIPGLGASPENTRSQSLDDLAATMAAAVAAAGLLTSTRCTGPRSERPCRADTRSRIRSGAATLIMESPAALRPKNGRPEASRPKSSAPRCSRPESAPAPAPPEVIAKRLRLLGRLSGPNQDPDLIERMRTLSLPVLVLSVPATGSSRRRWLPGTSSCWSTATSSTSTRRRTRCSSTVRKLSRRWWAISPNDRRRSSSKRRAPS